MIKTEVKSQFRFYYNSSHRVFKKNKYCPGVEVVKIVAVLTENAPFDRCKIAHFCANTLRKGMDLSALCQLYGKIAA